VTGHSAPPRDAGPAPILAARLARAYPNLPPHCAARLAEAFVRVGKAQHTHAERLCNGEPTRKGDVPGYGSWHFEDSPTRASRKVWRHDSALETAAAKRIQRRVENLRYWAAEWIGSEDLPVPNVYLENDPRGTVLRIWLPGDEPATDSRPAHGVV
jgi:hypothetical protein